MSFNPMLPVLVGLALVPLLWGWNRPLWRAWAVVALVATAALWPALEIPDGIPSPAAITGQEAPWRGVVSTVGGHPVQSDVVYQIQPWMVFARQELRQGRLPFWNPHQYAGAPFWSNGQSAPLFPLHLLFAALPLSFGWLLLPWLRMVIAGLGARALGRRLGLGPGAALLAGAAFPLTGMAIGFWQYPMGNAIALVPWVLWAVEGLSRERKRLLPLALLAGLQGLAGHPETVLHTALISALYLLVRGATWRLWGYWLAGWSLGGALAAIQLVPLAALVLESSRWQAAGGSFAEPLGRLLQQPLRLVLPGLYGDPAAGTWWGPYNVLATGVYAGALALPLAAAGFEGRRRERCWLAVSAILVFALLAAYHLPGVRHLLTIVPLIGKALHHRLLFAVDLALVLLLAAGWESLKSGRFGRRGLLWGSLGALVMVVVAWVLHAESWRQEGLLVGQAWATAALVAALALLALAARPSPRWRLLWLILPALVLVDLLVAHRSLVPAVSQASFYPRTGAIEFLSEREGRLVATGSVLRPNAATVYGLDDVRGDDTLKLAPAQEVHRELFGTASPTFFEPVRRWPAAALDRLAVRWVMTGPEERAPPSAGVLAYGGPDARVFERPMARPIVRWADGGAAESLEVLKRVPGYWEITWQSSRPRVLEVAETAAPGWRLRSHGSTAAQLAASDDYLLQIEVGAGSGRLELEYRPPGWWPGVIVSALALGALAVLWRRSR
ncbi:MAG: hypothetical protein AAF604_01250 [Acidobacteriota bacterium]